MLDKRLLLKIIAVIILLNIPSFGGAWGGSRKTVAVVLSGGGAKGVAHVRVLKALEKAGIPVDIIVGTSMGSLVGGLYAAGYNADQLDSIVKAQNWTQLLTDQQNRNQMNYSIREQKEKYILSGDFSKSPFEIINGGLLKGNNIAMLLSTLTADYQDSIDYNKLPIRYACVATNLMDGTEVDMHSGILAESMRTSMAIPAVFAPVRKNGMVLVDGGLSNNFPVDVARKMGADIVIGVNVGGNSELKANKENTAIAILIQMIGNACSNKTAENIKLTDVYIPVDVEGYSAASFTDTAIDSLLVRGDKAVEEHWGELISLKKLIFNADVDVNAGGIQKPRKWLGYTGKIVPPASIYDAREKASYIGLGVRFDKEELASLLVGGSYQIMAKNDLRASLDIRLGKRTYGDLRLSVKPFDQWMVVANYKLLFNNMDVYNEGESAADVKYTENFCNLHISRAWRMMMLSFGAEFVYRKFTKINTISDYSYLSNELDHEKNIKYYLQLEYDNMNYTQYPTKGVKWSIRYNYFTDNGYQFGGGQGQHIVEGYYKMAIPLTGSTTVVPYIAARSISSRNNHFSNLNVVGGIDHYGFYMPQQLSFAGANYIEIVGNNVAVLGSTVAQRLTKNNYVFGVFNVLTEGPKLKEYFHKQEYGCAIGYGYSTPVGPIQFNLNWSTFNKRKLGWYLAFGFNF